MPQLANGNLLLEGSDDLALLRTECLGLIADVEQLCIELEVADPEQLGFRLSNIAAAADLAIVVGGVVWVA